MCRWSWNLGASTSWNPQGLSRSVKGSLYLYVRLCIGFSSFRDMTQFWAFVIKMADFRVQEHQWILVRLNKYPPALGRQWREVLCSHFYSVQVATYSVSLTHSHSWIRFTCEQAVWRKFLNLQITNKLSSKLTSRLCIGNPGARFMACALCGTLISSGVCIVYMFSNSTVVQTTKYRWLNIQHC